MSYLPQISLHFFLSHLSKSPTFKFISKRNNALGNKIFIAITFSTSVIGYVINVEKNFVPSYDVMIQTINELYTAPWMRVAPYCVGVGFGWYLNSYRKTFAVSYVGIAKSLTLLNYKIFFGLSLLPHCPAAGAKFSVLHFNTLFGASLAQHNNTA